MGELDSTLSEIRDEIAFLDSHKVIIIKELLSERKTVKEISEETSLLESTTGTEVKELKNKDYVTKRVEYNNGERTVYVEISEKGYVFAEFINSFENLR